MRELGNQARKKISASSYKHGRLILIAIFKYAISLGIVLDNVAEDALPTRTISSKQLIIPTQKQTPKNSQD